MQPRHAVVKNGRLTLDEPTDLPEGHVVVLIPLEELLEEFGMDAADADEEPETFRVAMPPRRFREPPKVGAQALLDEIRSLD